MTVTHAYLPVWFACGPSVLEWGWRGVNVITSSLVVEG